MDFNLGFIHPIPFGYQVEEVDDDGDDSVNGVDSFSPVLIVVNPN